jgi:hypothetical protein
MKWFAYTCLLNNLLIMVNGVWGEKVPGGGYMVELLDGYMVELLNG